MNLQNKLLHNKSTQYLLPALKNDYISEMKKEKMIDIFGYLSKLIREKVKKIEKNDSIVQSIEFKLKS